MKKFIPDIIAKDIHDIDYDMLYDAGIRLLIFDIDGTLIDRENGNISERTIELLADLKKRGFTLTLLTKCIGCLDSTLEKTKIKNGFKGRKFEKKPVNRVLNYYSFSPKETAMIGNNIVTDIYSANSFGVLSIFVGTIGLEPLQNKFNSFVLRKIKQCYNK